MIEDGVFGNRQLAIGNYNASVAPRWKGIADWGKYRPGVLRLADWLGRGRGRVRWWDEVGAVPRAPVPGDLSGWEDGTLAALWVGHATVLLRLGDKTILTDPVFSQRIGLGLGFITGGPRRLIAPAVRIEALPPVDLILLSHAHFDHLDRPTLHRLPKSIPIVTAWHTRDLLDDLGFSRITELRWGERYDDLSGLSITAQPVRHWGARTFADSHRGCCAYLLEGAGKRVLFGGDTAYHDRWTDLGQPGVDLAILGIGAYNPWIDGHATPEQALAMADHCRADRILPMHHATFRLSHEPPEEPLARLLAATPDPARLVATRVGARWDGD